MRKSRDLSKRLHVPSTLGAFSFLLSFTTRINYLCVDSHYSLIVAGQ